MSGYGNGDATLPLAGPATTGGALTIGQGILGGVTVDETASAAAKIRLWDSASAASGPLIFSGTLTALGSLDVDFNRGRRFANGVFLEIVSGAVQVSIGLA